DQGALRKDERMQWFGISTAFWKGFTAYLEFHTVDDATVFERLKDMPKAEDGRSWFGAQAVVAHNVAETPRELPEAASYAIRGKSPQSADELAVHYQRLILGAIEAWRNGTMDEAQAAFLDSFVRNGFLPTAI